MKISSWGGGVYDTSLCLPCSDLSPDSQSCFGFKILYAREERGFAPFNGEDDYFIRIIAQKVRLA